MLLALVLRLLAGERWFSFYGAAAVVLAVLPFVLVTLTQAARAKGLTRWPVWLAAALTALPALIQIGFWSAFFTLGADGATLAIGRGVVMSKVGNLLPWLAAGPAALWLWSLWRVRGA